jgi:glycosyltransferase involved in cell wall biosynthesis
MGIKCTRNEGQAFDADVCIYTSLQGERAINITAHKRIQVVHADPREAEVNWDHTVEIDHYVAVGEDVQRILKDVYKKDSVVIPNFMRVTNYSKVLRLITASRITEKKGFARILTMARALKAAGRPFIWEIHGTGAPGYMKVLEYDFADIPEVCFVGGHNNVIDYMRNCDFLVQLSDHEGFCYAIHEALSVGVPCIVTDWPGVREVIMDGVNGFVLPMDMHYIPINEMYEPIPALGLAVPRANRENILDSWLNLFDN